MTEQTDIGTLEQEIRQVRARLARVEGERDSLLAALDDAAFRATHGEIAHCILICDKAIATVKGSQ